MRLRRHVDPQAARRKITAWRVELLCGAGFDEALAERLAGDGRYDIHALLELVDRGCQPELAARILAPLDHEMGEGC
jgi:hypothetical protein